MGRSFGTLNEIGKRRFNVEVPPRCGLHQMGKGGARAEDLPWKWCVFCAHYTKNLDSATCLPCLQTKNLDRFTMEDTVAEEAERYGIPSDWRDRLTQTHTDSRRLNRRVDDAD